MFSLARRIVVILLALVLARVTDTWLTDAVFIVAILNTFWYAANSVECWTETRANAALAAGDFDVILEYPGDRVIDVVKLLRQSADVEFQRAQGMVDRAPSTVCQSVSYDYARELAECLHSLGAEASIRLPHSATATDEHRGG